MTNLLCLLAPNGSADNQPAAQPNWVNKQYGGGGTTFHEFIESAEEEDFEAAGEGLGFGGSGVG